MSVTEEEWQTLVDAFVILNREKENLVALSMTRAKALSAWGEYESFHFVSDIVDEKMITVRVYATDEDNWETTAITFTQDEVRNSEHEETKYKAIFEAVEAERLKDVTAKQTLQRRKQYEALKKEFEGGSS